MQPHATLPLSFFSLPKGSSLAPFRLRRRLGPHPSAALGPSDQKAERGRNPFCRARAEVLLYYVMHTSFAPSLRRGGPPAM
jgi:hypothetical protein